MYSSRRDYRAILAAILLSLILASCVACVKQGTIVHPGQANTFDGQAYDTIITLRAAVQQASMEVANFPMYKDQVNQAVASFNALEQAYITYHQAALAGQGTPVQETALSNQISSLVATVSKLESAFGVKLQ